MDKREPCRPDPKERLSAFAGSHFMFSISGAIVLMIGGVIGLELESRYGYQVFFALLIFANLLYMAIYVLLGRWSAREWNWTAPATVKEGFLAFLFPALIAWCWGGLVLAASFAPGLGAYGLATAAILFSFFLASPAFLMVFTAFACGWMVGGLLSMILCVLVVGGLPPALFLLGSIWGSRKSKQSNEETEVPDGTQPSDATA